MLRGRHRGLPVASDRAVLLPHEYKNVKKQENKEDDVRGDGRQPNPDITFTRTMTQSQQPNEKPPAVDPTPNEHN